MLNVTTFIPNASLLLDGSKEVTRDQVDFALVMNDTFVRRAIGILFDRQTYDEQDVEETKYLNARGFNKWSARQGTLLARKVTYNEEFTQEEVNWARNVAMVHSKQLVEYINNRMGF